MLVAKQDLDYYNEQVETKVVKNNRKRKKKKQSNALYKLMLMGIVIIGLILSLFVLYRYAYITKVRLEITRLNEQKIELQKEKENLLADLESIKSSTKIEEDATLKLGMDYPSEDQIVYVDITEPVLVDEVQQAKEYNIIGQLKNVVNLVLGFF